MANQVILAKTISHDTDSTRPNETDVRTFNLASRHDRFVFQRFISWCIANDKGVKVEPFKVQ